MMIELVIPDIPPSVNHYWVARGNRRFISKRGREWKQLVYIVANCKANKKYFDEKLEVEITISLPDKRRRDVDNFSKAILDSLEKICYKDDCQIYRLTVQKTHGKPKTVIRLKPFSEVANDL